MKKLLGSILVVSAVLMFTPACGCESAEAGDVILPPVDFAREADTQALVKTADGGYQPGPTPSRTFGPVVNPNQKDGGTVIP